MNVAAEEQTEKGRMKERKEAGGKGDSREEKQCEGGCLYFRDI